VLNAVSERFGHQFKYSHGLTGADAIDRTGNPLPDATLDLCRNSDAILFGAIGHPKFDNDPSAKVRPEQGLLRLRKELQLFANIRPVNTYPSLHHLSPLKKDRLEHVDFVIYRELTGGIYFGNKETAADGSEASDLCVYNRSEIERIARLAFEAAGQRRRKLTLVDKANVLETSRLWRRVVREVAPSYPDVAVDYLFVDNAAMQIIVNPAQFDVMLTLGMLPSASIGTQTAMFEPIHGSYPQAAGKDIANPVGSILSAAMLLDYLNLYEEATSVRDAVKWALDTRFVTKDIDPINYYFTSTVGDLISDYIAGRVPNDINQRNVELRKSTLI
jgi:3-isopropylmalate dehydrogenase